MKRLARLRLPGPLGGHSAKVAVRAVRTLAVKTWNALPVGGRLDLPGPDFDPDADGDGPPIVWWSFALFVLLPTILFFLYNALWESDGFVSETRMMVLAAERPKVATAGAGAMISRIMGSAATDTGRDAYIVLNYVKSSAIIEDLGGAAHLEAIYAKPRIDIFSRLSKGEPIEELLQYWKSRVSASVDTISGILTVKVTAYDPVDAQRLAQDINRLSEQLLNTISLRSRSDALAKAQEEVARSGAVLAGAREKLLSFRNANEMIDPGYRASSLGETIAKLTLEKIDAETSMNVLAQSLSSDSPTSRVMRTKIATLDDQINELKAKLTAPKSTDALSAQIAGFERLKLDEQFAERVYVIGQDAYLRARQELDKQQLFLATVVAPVLPEEATYPKIFASTLLLFVSLAIFWSIGALIWASIKDQMD
jgi:capsular polysaccharide transport system permease protein